MKKTISARDFDKRFLREMETRYNSLTVDADGSIYPKGVYHWLLDPVAAMTASLDFAMAYHVSHEEEYQTLADQLLDYLERNLIRQEGYIYWATPYPPSLCQQGRWSREALRAAQLTGNKKALEWMCEMFNAWPYDHEGHRFVERFMPGTHLPTSVNGFLTTYNMIADGMVNCWILAKETGCPELLGKARDTLCNFILPGQREDGLWSYHAKRDVDMGLYNDGEEEYNYNLYLLYILSHLLADEDARNLIQEPLRRSFDELYRRFNLGDGSMYAPVHWGWDHIWEGAIYAAVISWRLYHYCGLSAYEDQCAKSLHWMIEADFGVGRHGGGYSGIGLYWGSYFYDLYMDDFCVTGNVAERAHIIRTLEMVHSKFRVVRPDNTHRNIFFGTSQYNTVHAIERKIMRMKKQCEDTATIARVPETTTLQLPWQFNETGYAAIARISFDDEALYVQVQTNCKDYQQAYEGPSLFAGDSILLDLSAPNDTHARLSLAREGSTEVIYLYNDKIPFRGDLRLYIQSEPRGWYLGESDLTMTMTSSGLLYDVKIVWDEIGLKPQAGETFNAGLAVIKQTPYGPQFNQWGRTGMEDLNNEYKGKWTF